MLLRPFGNRGGKRPTSTTSHAIQPRETWNAATVPVGQISPFISVRRGQARAGKGGRAAHAPGGRGAGHPSAVGDRLDRLPVMSSDRGSTHGDVYLIGGSRDSERPAR